MPTYHDIASETTLANIHADLGTTLHADLGTTLHNDLGTTLHNDLQALLATRTTEYDTIEAAVATANANAALAVAAAELDRQSADNIYPGRNLATVLADEMEAGGYTHVWQLLHARMATGDFSGLRISDYFDVTLTPGTSTISQTSARYVLAAFDHYYNCSDQPIAHHIVCVPYEPINMSGSSYAVSTTNILWNTTATNQGTSSQPNPYLNSNLHKWEINEYLGRLPSALQGYLLNHRSLVEHRYSSSSTLNDSTSWGWADLGKIWSPSEMEVYGCLVWGTKAWSQGMDSQFPLFRETKNRIMGGRVGWWLRSAMGGSSSYVCDVRSYGVAGNASALDAGLRPRPCFLLG